MKRTYIYGCDARGDYDSLYLTRYTLFECWLFQICIHVFTRSDADDLHDHPWNFLSIILYGGYLEQTPTGKHRKCPGMILFRKGSHRHRVELIKGRKAITLVIMGKRYRDWGFWRNGIWTLWTKYFKDNNC